MSRPTKKLSRLTSAATNEDARPPQGFGERASAGACEVAKFPERERTAAGRGAVATATPHFLLWQLADSAFPTGGFAHSGGLEAAAQNGEIRNRTELREWLQASLRQVSRAALPLANAAHQAPERVAEFDRLCDAFITNHVANRASRLQGRAFLLAAERIFKVHLGDEIALECAHLPPVFGCAMRRLEIDSETMRRLFVFQHLRGVIASAVRLNLVGPMEGQVIQSEMATDAEAVVAAAEHLGLGDLSQTAPLLDVWQGTQDRLYSRLFQS